MTPEDLQDLQRPFGRFHRVCGHEASPNQLREALFHICGNSIHIWATPRRASIGSPGPVQWPQRTGRGNAMHFELSEEHRMLKDLVARFVRDELMPLETAVMLREAE